MPVAEAVSTFAGIGNENEFYGHHYLAEVFKGDIKAKLEAWDQAEEGDSSRKAPPRQLASFVGKWFALRDALSRARGPDAKLVAFKELHSGLLSALGYAVSPRQLELHSATPVPVWDVIGQEGKAPTVVIVPAYTPGQEAEDTLDQM